MRIDRNSIVDKMARRGRAQTDQKSLDTVKRELEVVPTEVLSAIDKIEARLVIVNEDEDPLNVEPQSGAPFLNPIHPDSYGPMLRKALVPALSDVESTVAHLDRIPAESMDSGMKAMVAEQRFQTLDGEIQKRSGGLVKLLDPRTPTTLESLAKSRGASTPKEVQELSQLILTVSGEERSERAFASAADPVMAEIFKQLPKAQRPLQGELLIPSVAFFERNGTRSLLHEREADWAKMTENREWAGYYRSDINTVFLREEYLGETNEGTSTPVHEFGHAFGDMLSERYPAVFHTFKAERDRTFVELHKDPERRFPTNYSAVNASEFVAETFAVRFDPDREQYPQDGGQWHDAFEASLEHVIAEERELK